jgi:hypothetical protein
VEEELKRLAGTWVLVDRWAGDTRRYIEPHVLQVSESGDANWSGQEIDGFWTTSVGWRHEVNPDVTPKKMSVIVGEESSPKVYDLSDDTLTICSGLDGTRPKKVGIDKFVNYWRYVRGLDKGRELLVQRLLEQLEAEYQVSVWPRAARETAHWPHKGRLKLEGNKLNFEKDGAAVAYEFTLNPLLEANLGAGKLVVPRPRGPGDIAPAKKPFVPLHMDVQIGDVTYKGVYKIDADNVRFCYFSDKPDERPEQVDAEGAVRVDLTRIGERRAIRAPGLRRAGAAAR